MSEEPIATPEPTEPAPIPTSTSEQVEAPPVAPESPTEAESAIPVNNDNSASSPENSPVEQPAPADAEAVADRQTENPSSNEPLSETPAQPTAQVTVIEPFAKLTLLAKAREMIQFRKRKKLEKIMGMFLKQSSITNDEVEKLLHVSDATATRYLSQLEKEGKIKQEGRTGKSVSYSRM
ncbi:MAG: winged helix-turn-helix transcriptional regulator [Minisyncoccia bacterium]